MSHSDVRYVTYTGEGYILSYIRMQVHILDTSYFYHNLHSVMDTSPKKRSKVITLHQFSDMSQRQIAKECGISNSTVYSIIKVYEETGSISPKHKSRCGCKRSLITSMPKRVEAVIKAKGGHISY